MIYYATEEFRCPAEVICDQLRELKSDRQFHWEVAADGQSVIFHWDGYPPNQFLNADFMDWLDAEAAENAYDNGCDTCGTVHLHSHNLAWDGRKPICIVCACDLEKELAHVK